jgi:hypothetical protein
VGERGDEVSVARFIADQRTNYRVPHTVSCVILGLSPSWFYKWIKAPVTGQGRRRAELDAEVRRLFEASDRTYGSPRIYKDLLEKHDGRRQDASVIATLVGLRCLGTRMPADQRAARWRSTPRKSTDAVHIAGRLPKVRAAA